MVEPDNSIRGIITSGSKAWTIGSPAAGAGPAAAAAAAGPLASTVASPQDFAALPSHKCDTHGSVNVSNLAAAVTVGGAGGGRSLLQVGFVGGMTRLHCRNALQTPAWRSSATWEQPGAMP